MEKTKKGVLWTSYILQGIVSAMFLMGAANNLMKSEMAVTGALDMGFDESSIVTLGILLLVSTALYIIPKTNIFGAVMLTAWLGGAVATHMIHGDPIGMTIFPVIFGIIVWFALVLRDKKLQAIFPFSK